MKKFISFITGISLSLSLVIPFTLAQQADAMLELRPSVPQASFNQTFQVQVIVKNPGAKDIISVRSWIEYDANQLKAVSINSENSPFTLAAPGEDKIESGLLKIGRASIEGGDKSLESMVSTITFSVKTQEAVNTVLKFHDYKFTELGHTNVNIMEDGFPINILSEAPEELIIPLNGGASGFSQDDMGDVGGGGFADLARPENLRVNTGEGYVQLRWDMSDEPGLVGYYVYYGRNSGEYTRRRDVGKANEAFLEGLKNGDTYYFAVTAYDSIRRESDYSNEVGVIVGKPLSATHPFEDLLNSLLANLPAQPQNGPLTWWLLISAAGLAWVVLFGWKKKRS